MKLIRTYPVYFAISCLLFLQIPMLIAGTADNRKWNFGKGTYRNSVSATSGISSSKQGLLSEADSLYQSMELQEKGIKDDAFRLAYIGYAELMNKGTIRQKGLLTIVDFSKPSTEERLYVIDMDQQKVLIRSLVAHGKNSGQTYAKSFSNIPESNKSSLGFYLTLGTYEGGNGYSMQLKGLEKGINDKAFERAIVMHGADYVSRAWADANGYIGRSLGCPAVPVAQTKKIINTIKNGSVLFIFHPNSQYIHQSRLLNS